MKPLLAILLTACSALPLPPPRNTAPADCPDGYASGSAWTECAVVSPCYGRILPIVDRDGRTVYHICEAQ